jgi:hypothetical protein
MGLRFKQRRDWGRESQLCRTKQSQAKCGLWPS